MNVRVAGAKALGHIGPKAKSEINVLESASEDENALVQQAAAEALEKIKRTGK